MFEDLPEFQLEQLTKVWDCTLAAMHWRERSLYEMGRAHDGLHSPSTSPW
jgi:hypothetical protein